MMLKQRTRKAKNGGRIFQDVILLIVEGDTEEACFKAIKKRGVKIVIDKTFNFKLHSVDKSISNARMIAKKYDISLKRSYLVFDTEHVDNSRRHALKRMNAESEINVIVSSSCFEVWILLHYVQLHRSQFSSPSERLKELIHFVPSYNKGNNQKQVCFFEQLHLTTGNDAIVRANTLMKQFNDNETDHTFTQVHVLVDHINRMNSR